MKTEFNPAHVAAQVAKGMALAFFANAFAELSGHLEPHGGAKLPEVIDPAAHHAAFTLSCGLRSQNGEITGLDQLYDNARRAHRLGEGHEDMTPAMFGYYLAMQSQGLATLETAFGAHVSAVVTVPYVEFGAHSLERDYS
jgi:hypothetical protein